MSRKPQLPMGAVMKEDGSVVIPATQRADGTWRKEKKVKSGYMPQDEVQSYTSAALLRRESAQRQYPVGWDPALAQRGAPAKAEGKSKTARKNDARKKKKEGGGNGDEGGAADDGMGVAELAEAMMGVRVEDEAAAAGGGGDVGKRLRAASKKLRLIDELRAKVDRGEVVPNDEQKDKLSRRAAVAEEVRQLELELAEQEGSAPPPSSVAQPAASSSSHKAGAADAPPSSCAAGGAGGESDAAKRLKNLRKKLKQIEELEKTKGPLDADQQLKLSKKAEVLAAIAELEG